jgi:hypothetical protein
VNAYFVQELAEGGSYLCPECRKSQASGTPLKRKLADKYVMFLSILIFLKRVWKYCWSVCIDPIVSIRISILVSISDCIQSLSSQCLLSMCLIAHLRFREEISWIAIKIFDFAGFRIGAGSKSSGRVAPERLAVTCTHVEGDYLPSKHE